MEKEFLSAILSGFIGGVFTILAVFVQHKLKKNIQSAESNKVYGGFSNNYDEFFKDQDQEFNILDKELKDNVYKQQKALSFITILKDLGMIVLVQAILGIFFGFLSEIISLNDDEFLGLIALVTLLLLPTLFAIVGAKTKTKRWRHLLIIALLLWLTGIINVFIGIATIEDWITGLFLILLLMAIGGGLSFLFSKPHKGNIQ